MSRRHPLSSLRATGTHPPSQEANRPISPTTRRLQSADDLELRRDLLLLGNLTGLLRSLLHCALRLLLRFLSHSALRCEMAQFAACIRESICTSFRIHQHLKKNRAPLKEALTQRGHRACCTSLDQRASRAKTEAKNPRANSIGENQDHRKRLCRSRFCNSHID
jgi:hypothetical protein